MFNSLYHAEIGGGYTLRRKVIINAADLRPLGGQIEVAALIENGDELNHTTVTTEAAAPGKATAPQKAKIYTFKTHFRRILL